MKRVVLIIALFLSGFSFAQESYKYIIIPSQFSFLKEVNKYGLNELTKSFFQSEGFEVYYDTDKLPDELLKNRCLALTANAVESNTMFLTKIHFELKDCSTQILLKSEIGTSREKEYKVAYSHSFRQALTSLKGKMNFKKESKEEQVEVVETQKDVVVAVPSSKSNGIIDVTQLRAVATETGYSLVNYTDNVVLILYTTSLENVFIALKDIFKGVLIKKNTAWFFEYDFEGKVYSEKIEVKF